MTKVDVPPLHWQELGAVSPDLLLDTRLELHWAAQVIGAVPLACLDETPDFRHANLGWIADTATFVTRPVGSIRCKRTSTALEMQGSTPLYLSPPPRWPNRFGNAELNSIIS